MTRKVTIAPLTAQNFAPYGDVLDASGAPDKIINAGQCGRFHDRANVDVMDARVGISIFKATLRSLPYTLDLIERHPEGSQAFVPMSDDPFLVIVKQPLNEWALAVERVRFVGEAVAVVVAKDRYIAEDALDLVEVLSNPTCPWNCFLLGDITPQVVRPGLQGFL